ncbi:diacylglycerol/lipid kinase family protein [Brevibacterium linens]|uniref:Diacylglycerol kinase family enzyme n=1 Tax=Brevibacterium linens TaxID=1703 RepID=A0A2H1HWR7_BRELN|nr:diacylglycerol kinase family protein [Brevibacterium linens]SMX67300.1 Diacylglycerol kinase family enzyme [Brevibacterium linens]
MDELNTTRTPLAGRVAETDRPGSTPQSIAVGIILNPKHPATLRAYAELVPELRNAGAHYRSMTTSVERSGRWQAAQLIAWGADTVIILGGDGTIRATAPVLAEAGTPTFLIPTGTANVLSRHIGLRSSRHAIDLCVRTLPSISRDGQMNLCGVPINIAEFQTADGRRHRTDFISLAGIGGDARAVAHHRSAPGLLGYAWGAARALFAADFTASTADSASMRDTASIRDAASMRDAAGMRDTARAGEATASGPVWSVMVSKVARPAGPIAVFPEARIGAQTFSMLTVGPFPRSPIERCRAWAEIAAACLRGRPDAHRLMDYRSTTVTTVAVESPVPAQLDGDFIGDCLELRVSTGEKTLLVSAPTA